VFAIVDESGLPTTGRHASVNYVSAALRRILLLEGAIPLQRDQFQVVSKGELMFFD